MIKHEAITATAGNANADITAPDDIMYKVLYGQIVLVTDATVANRRVLIQVIDASSNVIFDVHAGAVQAASLTYHYEAMQGVYRETSVAGLALQFPMPKDFIIPEGYSLRIDVENGVAGDSYTGDFIIDEVSKAYHT